MAYYSTQSTRQNLTSPADEDKENSIMQDHFNSEVRTHEKTAKFISGSKHLWQLSSAKRNSDQASFRDSRQASNANVVRNMHEFDLVESFGGWESQPLQEIDSNTGNPIARATGQSVESSNDGMDKEITTGGITVSSGCMLLPNPLPPRICKASHTDDQYSKGGTNSSTAEREDRSMSRSRLRSSTGFTSGSVNSSYFRQSVREDEPDFKEYIRKLHGKDFKERMEYLGSTLEQNIRENVQDNLLRVKEKILQRSKRNSVISDQRENRQQDPRDISRGSCSTLTSYRRSHTSQKQLQFESQPLISVDYSARSLCEGLQGTQDSDKHSPRRTSSLANKLPPLPHQSLHEQAGQQSQVHREVEQSAAGKQKLHELSTRTTQQAYEREEDKEQYERDTSRSEYSRGTSKAASGIRLG